MTSKLKYISIILIALGYWMQGTTFSIGPINGLFLLTAGIFILCTYAILKLIGK